ncbi:hypothetical protein [Granulicella sp. L46]|jgi:hypothetical protein|uniref:hypothetical protein n=1 Tax=Granulicella sp. L46 TaxID=1641865 RepID=UPI00131C585F|nr:hypothetical protein [Granulicella sp. L46]
MQRRLLSILLFWATLFPSFAPALTTGAMGQSTLPACCRRGAQHHCEMSPEARALLLHEPDGSTRINAKPQQCPYRQRSLGATHLQTLTLGAAPTQAAFSLHEPSPAAQTECLRRISFDRSRQKRGPPSVLA